MTSLERSKELYLLKRKREPEYFIPKINNSIIFQEEQAFSIINNSKLKNDRQIKESRNSINEIQPNPMNYGTNNFKNLLGESSNYLKQEYYKPKIIIDDKEGKLF